jgi:predicted dehydrogenase/nucleoside-diphosphate-sugar epimerase
MSKIFRVGIVGAGYVASHHLRALRDLPFVEVVGICDSDESRAKQMAARFGVTGVYPNLDAMRYAKPDVIHVLTPPASHCALSLDALDMGCHVFVEKPMADSAAECDAMIERARQKDRVLSVNHSARFDPVVLQAAELVRSGACGDILAVHFIRSSDYPPYAGGPLPAPYSQGSYPFRDLGVHGLYLLELFLGRIEHLEVTWSGSGRDPMLALDEWRAQAQAENGGTGYMFLSWNSRPLQNELWIHGTRGSIHVDCFLQTCELSQTLPGPKQIGFVINGAMNAARRLWNVPWNMVRFATGSLKPSAGIYRGVQDFYHALAAGAPVPVSPEEGRRMMELVCDAVAAADEEVDDARREEAARTMPDARILVTGGGGFLGSELVRRLRELGDPVRLLLRRPPTAGSPADPEIPGGPLSILYGSLGQPDVVDRAVRGVELVYHVGAAMKGGAAEFEQATVWGTRNIIDSCLRHGARRLVYVSSLSVLDHAGHKTGVPVTENSPYEPWPKNRGTYTRTKLEAEQMMLAAIRDRALPAVIIRPGQIFGPGAEQVTPNGVIKIAGTWIVAGSGRRQLPLVYRDDVVDALLLAAKSERAVGHVVNIVDPTPIVQNEYLQHQRRVLGKTRIWKIPATCLLLAGAGIELLGKFLKRDVPLSRYKIRSLKPLSPFDVTAAETLLGWKPAVGVTEGLQRTFPGGGELSRHPPNSAGLKVQSQYIPVDSK